MRKDGRKQHLHQVSEQNAARHGYQLLTPGRFAALIIGDTYNDKELVPLAWLCLQRMTRLGFKTKAIIVKNIEGNEKGKGKTNNLWRYRALQGGYYIFKHEYIILFFKPRPVLANPSPNPSADARKRRCGEGSHTVKS